LGHNAQGVVRGHGTLAPLSSGGQALSWGNDFLIIVNPCSDKVEE